MAIGYKYVKIKNMNILSRKIKNKYWLLFVTLATTVSLVTPHTAHAKPLAEIMTDLLAQIIYWLLIWPLSQVLKLELLILPVVAEYNNFTSQDGVVEGWQAMRDLSNMFFILILLVIALATILKIQSYGYRQLLKKLLIVAVLINFSKTIVGIAIDFSQVIMLTFVDVIKGIAAGNVLNALGLHKIMQQGEGTAESVGSSVVVAYFLGAIMLLITVMVMVAFLAMLAMRIVTLWVLIVLSPLAFLAFTFPKTEKYFNEWSEELLKNLIAGPSLAFFLWLAFSITGRGDVNNSFSDVPGANDASDPNSPVFDASKAASPTNVLNFVVGIAILVAGLQMTAKSGAAGAGMAGGMASKIKSAPGRVGRKAGGLAMAGAAAGAKTLYQGRSGEGMIKGRISRLRGMVGRGMAETGQQMQERGGIAGRVSGLVTRAGMRRVAADQGSRKRSAEYEATRAEGVTDQAAYWSSKRGDEAQYHASKAALSRGDTHVEMGAGRDNLDAARMSELFESHGDTDAATNLQKRSATVNTGESMQRNITDSGMAATLKNMNFEGMDAGNADHQAVLATILDQDGETRAKAMEGMDRDERNSLVAALQAFQVNDGQVMGATDANGNVTVNEDSQAFRQHMAMVQFGNAATAQTAYNDVGQHEARVEHDRVLAETGNQDQADASRQRTLDGVRGAFATAISRDVSGKQVAKMDAGSDVFQAMSGLMNAGQRAEFLSKTDDRDRRETMVAAQVQAGNVQVMMDGVATRDFVEDTNIQAYFNQQITATTADRGDRGDRMGQLARQNMSHAHLAFMQMDAGGQVQNDGDGNALLDETAFNEFARGLKLEELLKLPKEQLDRLSDDMDVLNDGMRSALAEKGYGSGGGDAAGDPDVGQDEAAGD
jgi:hypothetical protein